MCGALCDLRMAESGMSDERMPVSRGDTLAKYPELHSPNRGPISQIHPDLFA